ncbi:MAG: ThuA domain-containing protein [Chryseolinea sp.]
MNKNHAGMFIRSTFCGTLLSIVFCFSSFGQKTPDFKVIAFFTAKQDRAHISFVHEANKWFPGQARRYNFQYDSTDNWDNLNTVFLKQYQVILFLDTRPEDAKQREAFQKYMEAGGGWIGFHFSAFALDNSTYPQNWSWYHNTFLGSGEYGSNTWRPTSAILRVEDHQFAATRKLPETINASPNEWYRWKNDLRDNKDIRILLSVDSTSFPLGTGPKQHEIWHSGYYPVVWNNKNFNMMYVNMGHNDIDYDGGTNNQLSSTFGNPNEDELIIDAIIAFGKKKKSSKR